MMCASYPSPSTKLIHIVSIYDIYIFQMNLSLRLYPPKKPSLIAYWYITFR